MVNIPNSNLLLGVGGIIAAVFLVSQIRKAGADLQDSISGIKLPDINFPEFPTLDTSGFDSFLSSITDIFKQQQETLSSIAGDIIVEDDGSTITIPADTTVNPDGTISSDTSPLLDLSDEARAAALIAQEEARAKTAAENALAEIPASEDISGSEFASAINEEEFRRRQQEEEEALQQVVPPPEVESQLPTDQIFEGGGESFIGGFIFENPIDTLSEVLDLFPQLTASQAADFLAEFSGILPSELGGINPDIENIVAGIDGESIPIQNVSVSDLEQQEQIAACTSCGLFGLNCDICNG